MHHALTSKDLRNQCPYCAKDLKELPWHTHHESVRMYKAFHCDCGKFINFPVRFLGSGHDSFDKNLSWKGDLKISFPQPIGKVQPLEARLKIVKEYSMHP